VLGEEGGLLREAGYSELDDTYWAIQTNFQALGTSTGNKKEGQAAGQKTPKRLVTKSAA
jgi:hypothetical protein